MLDKVYCAKSFFIFDIFSEAPIVTTDKSHVLVSPGDDVNLTCHVISERFPDIRWFKGNEPVKFCSFEKKPKLKIF